MSRHTLADILFWSLATLSVALFVALILVVGGAIPIDSPSEPAAASTEALPSPPPAATTEQATTEPPADTTPATTAPATTTPATTAPPASAATIVVVTASRGDSWFSARVGSESGRVLDERVLAQGESAQIRGTRIWLSVGAAGNVDLTVDGKPRALSPGTVSVVLTPPRTAAANS